MKFSVLFLLWMSFITISFGAFMPTPTMERLEKIDVSRQFILTKQGEVKFAIVVPNGSNKTVAMAAEEMAKILQRACGSKITVTSRKAEKTVSIMLGELALQSEFQRNCKNFDRDGFVILSKPDIMVIAGRDTAPDQPGYEHGTLFAVYDFLERFAGIRFYFPGDAGTIVHKLSDWRVPFMEIQDRPDFQVRNIYWWAGVDGKKPGWHDDSVPQQEGMQQHWRRLRLETLYIPSCHGLAYLDLVERFAESNPEYFALSDNGTRLTKGEGHLCFSSAVTEEIYRDACAALTGESASSRNIRAWRSGQRRPFFDLMPNDGMLLCKCENCGKYQSSAEISKFIWDFVCDMGERLKRDMIEGYLTFSSYSPYRDIPVRSIPDNVLVMKALSGPYMEGQESFFTREKQIVLDWYQKLNRKIWLWTYVHKLHGPAGIPNMIPKAVGQFYGRMSPYIFGALMEAESDIWLSNYLGYYVFAKLAWNNKIDVNGILSEHFDLMFSSAAEPMKHIYQIFEEKWLRIVGRQVETNLGPSIVKPTRIELWNEIYSKDERDKLSELFNLAEKLAGDEAEVLERLRIIRKNLWEPALIAAEEYRRETDAKSHWLVWVPEIPAGADINLDGHLTESVWRGITPFYLLPLKGDRVRTHTKIRLLRDTDCLYLAFECDEPKTDAMLAVDRVADDTEIWRDNSIEIFLDPDGTGKEYCQIIINSAGCVSDQYYTLPGTAGDWQWNSAAQAKVVTIPKKLWQMEVAIPLKNLKTLNQDGFTANFCRSRVVDGEQLELYKWSPYSTGFHDVENFGKVLLAVPPEGNLLQNGDFSGAQEGRFIRPWAADKIIHRDTEVFLVGGASLRMDKASTWVTCSLRGILKPETNYCLSFYLKAEDIAAPGGLAVRLHDGGSRSWKDFPNTPYYGNFTWLRQEMKIRTEKDAGTESHPPTLAFTFRNGVEGTAWIDKVELVEVK